MISVVVILMLTSLAAGVGSVVTAGGSGILVLFQYTLLGIAVLIIWLDRKGTDEDSG